MTSEKTNYNTINQLLNRLSHNNVDYIDIIGLNVAILYSKEIFQKNSDINEFLEKVYNITFLPYVMKSRTLIVARITRVLNNKNKNELNEIRRKLIDYLKYENSPVENKTKSSKKDSNEKLKSWLEGL
ncbi:hypothetical protein ACW0TQ_08240 [Oceanobacillus sp. M60]